MRIVGIDQEKTSPHEVFFKTNPPLTQEVFDQFLDSGETDDFDIQDDFLIWAGNMEIQVDFIQEIERRLTEAETKLATEKIDAEKHQKVFLTTLAKETNLPLL